MWYATTDQAAIARIPSKLGIFPPPRESASGFGRVANELGGVRLKGYLLVVGLRSTTNGQFTREFK
jgi:hypothetical protein